MAPAPDNRATQRGRARAATRQTPMTAKALARVVARSKGVPEWGEEMASH